MCKANIFIKKTNTTRDNSACPCDCSTYRYRLNCTNNSAKHFVELSNTRSVRIAYNQFLYEKNQKKPLQTKKKHI